MVSGSERARMEEPMFDVDKANAGLTRAISTFQLAENEDLQRDPSLFQDPLEEDAGEDELSQFEEYAFSVMDEGEALGFDGEEVVETLLTVAHELGLSGKLPVIAGLGEDEEIDDVDPAFFEAAEEMGLKRVVLEMMQEACSCGEGDSDDDSDDDDSDDDDEDDSESKEESVDDDTEGEALESSDENDVEEV